MLAEWITSKDNPFFAQVMANRVWSDLMERGLVEPVDDLRASNPPSNGPLLEALAAEYGADEVMVVTITYEHVARRRSYELLAEAFDLVAY
mgnify:CR=1 FL=1